MKLMTKELEARFNEVGSQEGKGMGAVVIASYFHPLSSWRWYATEKMEGDECFGFVVGFEQEWGYFNLAEMAAVKPLPVERDLHWKERTVKEALAYHGIEL